MIGGFEGFADLKKWLEAKPSVKGEVHARQYTEVFAAHLARPGDEKFAERMVAGLMAYQIERMGRGLIHWRIPFESEIKDDPQIIEYCEDGPDLDFATNKRCRKDHNWKSIKGYCRLAVEK